MNCLSPSILSADFSRLGEQIRELDEAGHSMYILMSWTECLCRVFPSDFR